ncbi:S-layer homology domain-containing protein [Paenibacillus tyrfis]|uniref:S-layer homology domain-containing protein n=1 Tax=Paenibacillus tyrfis TaxID=1501230 RepID=UPI000B58F657|nr:S-layer homology domain-containing protein [Paenibacillus tyrfis]
MKPLKKAILTLAGCGILRCSFSSGTQAHWLFQDIDNVTWAQNSIINAYQMQVVDGVSEDRFDPGSSDTQTTGHVPMLSLFCLLKYLCQSGAFP